MILAILAACAAPLVFDANNPLFRFDGPPCTLERQKVDCACSEGFTWDPTPRAQWFEVWRYHGTSGQFSQVGITTATKWWVRSDFPFPRAGETYQYTVKACRRDSGVLKCSPQFSPYVRYKAARYACYKTGVEVACYPGDPVGN